MRPTWVIGFLHEKDIDVFVKHFTTTTTNPGTYRGFCVRNRNLWTSSKIFAIFHFFQFFICCIFHFVFSLLLLFFNFLFLVLPFAFPLSGQSMSLPPHASGQRTPDKVCTMNAVDFRADHSHDESSNYLDPGIQWITEQPAGHSLADPRTKDTAGTSNPWDIPRLTAL